MASGHLAELAADLAQHGLAILAGGDRVVDAVRVYLGEGEEDDRPGVHGYTTAGAAMYFTVGAKSTEPGVPGAGKWGLS